MIRLTFEIDIHVHICSFGSSIVDVYPKRPFDAKERKLLVNRAVQAGLLDSAEYAVDLFITADTDSSQ